MSATASEFVPFPKISRLRRDCIISEKLDGTNASVFITDITKDYTDSNMIDYFYGPDASTWAVYAGSRNRWLTPTEDNYGFAKWVKANIEELKKLGPGHHFGEWWGAGIQRNYGLTGNDKRFSLFNSDRWSDPAVRPACCSVVPVLYRGLFSTEETDIAISCLRVGGSHAVPGFMKPEGIVVYHTSNGQLFKQTCEGDEAGKSQESHVRAAPKVKTPRDPSKGGRRFADFFYEGEDRRVKK